MLSIELRFWLFMPAKLKKSSELKEKRVHKKYTNVSDSYSNTKVTDTCMERDRRKSSLGDS